MIYLQEHNEPALGIIAHQLISSHCLLNLFNNYIIIGTAAKINDAGCC